MKQPLAYSYIRFSSPEQAKGDSFRRQTEQARLYCERNNLELADFTLKDLGLSAYHGNHVKDGALGDFIDAVKSGQIPYGSYLLVESMDRLSREKISIAQARFLSLLELGINVVVLKGERVYTAESANDLGQIIYSLIEMSVAHEESEKKSMRLSAAQANKRKQARENKTPTGYRPPDWIAKVKEGRQLRYELIPERVEVVRRIYYLNNSGMGAIAIARQLNQEQLPAWGRSKTGWQTSYIKKILKTRTVLGEYHPHKSENGKRVPDGDPIPDFYPPIIDPQTFTIAQLTMRDRDKRSSGCYRKNRVNNLFTGLVRCKHCGNTMHFVDKGKPPKGGQYLLCSLAKTGAINKDGISCKRASIRYQAVEDAILTVAATLNLRLTKPVNEQEIAHLREQLSITSAELESIKSQIKRVIELLLSLPGSSGLLAKLEELEQQKLDKKSEYQEIGKRIDELEFTPRASNVWNHLQQTLKTFRQDAADRSNAELRTKINSQLMNCIDRIEFDNHAKVVNVIVDENRFITIRFDKKMKGYTVKPSWVSREYLPYTFVVKSAISTL
ncbi:recombinase family protein [Vibrio parahaemolyticus]|nr:recombinase family protein [Vibrio parahaemolyticus]ELC0687698.1 recombinase family protein [Vibrio parahaemolyticus]